MINNIFLKSALSEVPRLLGQLNRNPSSKTYGSFDRAYWHYRTNDISCARYQEAILTLTLLYENELEGNIYYKNSNILKWIEASLNFSCSIQNKNGSFSEWYVNESSFVCTSFITTALSEVLLILGKNNIKNYETVLKTLQKSADWITMHEEKTVLNQTSGSAIALLNVYKLTKDEHYKNAADEKINFILNTQTKEGWWCEYGGPDIGYLSLMIDYLSKYYLLEKDSKVLHSIKKATSFLVHFLHPNLTSGGEYMARNTEYLIPSGFTKLSQLDENSKIISEFAASAIESGASISPASLDDRYICYTLYNWIYAGFHFKEKNYVKNTKIYLISREFDKYFEEAGIRVLTNKNLYFVTNLRKGGSFRLYKDDTLYIDSGIEIKQKNNAYSSGALRKDTAVNNTQTELSSNGLFTPISEPLMRTPIMIIFKTFQYIFGKLLKQSILKTLLRKKMVTNNSKSKYKYERLFEICQHSITIHDTIMGHIPKNNISAGIKASYAFIPSAKYFTTQETHNITPEVGKTYSNTENKTTIKRNFNLKK